MDIIDFLTDVVKRVGGDEIWGYHGGKQFKDFLESVKKKESAILKDSDDNCEIRYFYYEENPGTNKWVQEIDIKIDLNYYNDYYLDEIGTLPKGFQEIIYSAKDKKIYQLYNYASRRFKCITSV